MEGVKTDFITHAYPLVNPLLEIDNLRMASLQDIAAMKLNAISHSGQRYKDYVDAYFLLEKMPFNTMLEAYEAKYPASNPLIPIKAITYFGDINFETDPPMFVKKVTFPAIQKRLEQAVRKPNFIF